MNSCEDVLLCMQDSKFHKEITNALTSHRASDVESHNICRIHVHARSFDWTQPPNRNKGGSGTGTGFVLDEFPVTEQNEVFIITCHHVIAHSVQIRVNFSKISSEYMEASLVGSNPDMDVALIVIKDDAFAALLREKGTTGLKKGDSDDIRPPADVTAHGFALGKPHMQTTKGVVSGRIENPSRLQTDVAVNPGNSGGPLLDDSNRVIGLVTSGMVDAQGINYAAPIFEACVICQRLLRQWEAKGKAQPCTERLPSLNCSFTKSNRVLLKSIDGCKSGVFCTSVHPLLEYPQTIEAALENVQREKADESLVRAVKGARLHPSMTRGRWTKVLQDAKYEDPVSGLAAIRNDTIQEGDIVCSMGVRGKTYDIDLQMTSKFDFWKDNIGFAAILDRLDNVENGEGDHVRLDYYRGSTMNKVDIPLMPQQNVFRKLHADADDVPYIVMGGIFVMPLLHNHISLFRREPMYTLMTRPDSRHESILILTHILPESPFNECETIGAGDVIVAINNTITFNLNDAHQAWEREMAKENEHVVTLRMRDGSLASASVKQVKDCNVRITQEYNSPEYIGFHASSEREEAPKEATSKPETPVVSESEAVPTIASPDGASSPADARASAVDKSDDDDDAASRVTSSTEQSSIVSSGLRAEDALQSAPRTWSSRRSDASSTSTLSSNSRLSDPQGIAQSLLQMR